MAITLSYTAGGSAPSTLTLSERLLWVDEHTWQAPQMQLDYGTLGDLMVHVRARQAGRPITLDGRESAAWTPRAQILQLAAWAAIPGAQFTLHIRGQDHTVMWDHTQPPALDATPLWQIADAEIDADTVHLPTLRFIEI
ncbi:hypothetical protein [Comamonas sp. NLF-1-9]|uniref:hypothetical protein n=1 Tax=Comamonas sp. NLF-1-9 TaxID=2853163 RepID=UPI001C4637F2|nr:hypothetical protein [Comamonas sp. NLF-1-9]QXL84092.1 hypothetical protein KUD94_12760 [Comamonas sp. NLF-1-9]